MWGFPDLHLKWLVDGDYTLQTPSEYPLQETEGECRVEEEEEEQPEYRPEYLYRRPYPRPRRQAGTEAPSDYQYKYFSTESTLLDWLQAGPVTTNVDVGGEDFQFYEEGRCAFILSFLSLEQYQQTLFRCVLFTKRMHQLQK